MHLNLFSFHVGFCFLHLHYSSDAINNESTYITPTKHTNSTDFASLVAGSEPRHLDAAEDHGSDTNVLVKQNVDGLTEEEHQV
jgi:hypothetical protein